MVVTNIRGKIPSVGMAFGPCAVEQRRLEWTIIGVTAVIAFGVARTGIAMPERVETVHVWETRADFDRCYRDRHLDSLSEPGTVKLVSRVLVADDLGAGYNNYQPVRGRTQAKKILLVDDPDVSQAMLLVDGSVSACDILINGTPLDTPLLEKAYWNANFERYVVPPALLKAGANAIVFRARDGNAAGRIRIERGRPNRSAVSHDGGFSWDFERLGEGGYMSGELGVRLNLGRYASKAWIASPIIDLAAAATRDGIPAGQAGRLEALDVQADTPRGTSVRLFVRTGRTPDGYEENWGAWHEWTRSRKALEFERFLQWRCELHSTSPRRTPVVRRVTARLSAIPVSDDPTFKRVQLVGDDNQRIVRSSYAFAYARHAGNSRILRDRWELADVIAPGRTEFEKLTLLRQWVREQWHNGWNHGALNYTPSWDARIILTLAPENLSLGMCTHYATVLVQCSQALGFPARSVFHGHAVTEIWSNEHQKWILMDPGGDKNDRRRATVHYERDGVPLSNLELHTAYFVDERWEDIRILATNMSEDADPPEPPRVDSPEELEQIIRDGAIEGRRQMVLELRNNFVDHREPEEPEHGMGYFKYLGHLFWKSAHTPDIPWTDFFTTREADLYWTLNQAQIHLLRDPETPGALRVLLDTVSPNFAGYEYRIDGGEWNVWTPGTFSGSVHAFGLNSTGGCIAFQWPLHPGDNMLEARTINKAGHRGITSRIVVEVETNREIAR